MRREATQKLFPYLTCCIMFNIRVSATKGHLGDVYLSRRNTPVCTASACIVGKELRKARGLDSAQAMSKVMSKVMAAKVCKTFLERGNSEGNGAKA